MKIKNFFSFGALSWLVIQLIACNGKLLTRSKAKHIIEQFIQRPENGEGMSHKMIYAIVEGQGERYDQDYKQLKPFIDAGLLRLKKKEVKPETDPVYWYFYEVTEKGKPYVLKEEVAPASYSIYTVKTFEWKVNEITGIKLISGGQQAVVDFSMSRENLTPFGDAMSKAGEIINFQAFFTLFDDGWRIERMDYAD